MANRVVHARGDDPAVAAAMGQARSTFKLFWRELSWEFRRIVPSFDMATIKAGFATDSNAPDAAEVEHLWFAVKQFDGVAITGELVNQPNWISTMNAGDTVSVPLGDLEDWMLVCEDVVFGAFTVHALRQQMSPKERKAHDRAWGLDFGDPEHPRILFTPPAPKPGLIARLFSKELTEPPAPFDPDDLPEHAMSEQSGAMLQGYIQQNADAVLKPDAEGMTMLHREALAGNLKAVQVLLLHGADKTLRNRHGDTPLDLARVLGWPKVIAQLE